MWKEGKKDSSVRKQTFYTVLLNSTTPTQEISGVRHCESFNEILKDCSLYIYNLPSSTVTPILSLKVKRARGQSSQNANASRIHLQGFKKSRT